MVDWSLEKKNPLTLESCMPQQTRPRLRSEWDSVLDDLRAGIDSIEAVLEEEGGVRVATAAAAG